MKVSDFQFDLPPDLIAQYPPAKRGDSRLLVLEGNGGDLVDKRFPDLPDLLEPGDLLVFNDTRVIPARLFGRKQSGGKVEVLIERVLDSRLVLAQVRASKSPKPGSGLILDDSVEVTVIDRAGDLFRLDFGPDQSVLDILEEHGHIPLPPYIERSDKAVDQERYQTVYSREPGAVAAPTAGLHFDQAMLERLKEKGVDQCFVTLHVGAGTFQPVRVEKVTEHKMHSELIDVSEAVCEQVARARDRGSRVVAVGTTALRALESASASGKLKSMRGETDIFIYPGYEFRSVDALITNFHLPASTLLMLVSAFAGFDSVMKAYRHAVGQQYRFFSYGDAMFITRSERLA